MSVLLDLYLKFRRELDLIEFESLKQMVDVKRITYCRKQVGFLIVRDDGFIEGIYVKPNYRRRGLATKAVRDYLKSGKYKVYRVGILDDNSAAHNFWNKLFFLNPIEDYGTYKVYSIVPKENKWRLNGTKKIY